MRVITVTNPAYTNVIPIIRLYLSRNLFLTQIPFLISTLNLPVQFHFGLYLIQSNSIFSISIHFPLYWFQFQLDFTNFYLNLFLIQTVPHEEF